MRVVPETAPPIAPPTALVSAVVYFFASLPTPALHTVFAPAETIPPSIPVARVMAIFRSV